MDKIRDAHYFPLSSQGNVHTLTDLQLANGTSKILAASLKREVFCFEYPDSMSEVLSPTTKEVLFTYIPGVVEIISIDAFNKSTEDNDFVIGITITKGSHDQTRENYLNIYSAWGEMSPSDFNLENAAQNCLNVELNFIPYQLYHADMPTWSSANNKMQNEVVWMLAGSDERVHVYREYTVNHTYKEIELKDHFPEFVGPPTLIMWMNVQYYDEKLRRLSAYGCECGYIKMTTVNTRTLEILQTFTTRFENSIASVRIYPHRPVVNNSLFRVAESTDNFNLLVANSILPSVVFMNVLECGLSDPHSLEGSDYFNITTCAAIGDLNFDGVNEVLLGKYGQEILLFKYSAEDDWQLDSIKSFANPVYSMLYGDVTGDGIKELIVLTLRGVHILQHDHAVVQDCIEKKMKSLKL